MRKFFTPIWAWIGVVLTGTIGSIVASIIFEGRLPRWLLTQKADPAVAELVIDWWRLGGIIGGGTLVAILLVLFLVDPLPSGPKKPTTADYKKDMFFGLLWRWRFRSDSSLEAACFCPTCDRQLVPKEVDRWPTVTSWNCSVHGELYRHEGEVERLLADATREVQRKLRNGEWKDVVQRQAAENLNAV